MDQKFDYKIQISTLITFTSWLFEEKNGQISGA